MHDETIELLAIDRLHRGPAGGDFVFDPNGQTRLHLPNKEPIATCAVDAVGRSEIDHVLATSHCTLTNAAAVTEVGPFKLAGVADAISDHAALVCEVTVLDGKADFRH